MKILYAIFPWINQHLVRVSSRFVFKYFLQLSWEGLDNLHEIKNRRVIFSANHTNELDAVVFTMTFPHNSRFIPMFYVSRRRRDYSDKSLLKRMFYGGIFFKMLGAFPVFSGKKDYEYSLSHHIRILELGLPVLIFPEGKIKRGDKSGDPRGGVAYLAERTDAVVVPVHISGIEDMLAKDFWQRRRHCHIKFGKPIYKFKNVNFTKERNHEYYKKGAAEVIENIYELNDSIKSLTQIR